MMNLSSLAEINTWSWCSQLDASVSRILVKKKLFQNNPNCAVTLVVPIVISLSFFHLFSLDLDLFSDFILQNFRTFRWHIEQLTIKHSIDALPDWEIEVSYYNHEHQKISIFQFQSMLMFHQKLLFFKGNVNKRMYFCNLASNSIQLIIFLFI